MIIAGMLIGGATIPRTPPIATNAAARSGGRPRPPRIVRAMTPVVRTEAVDEPVIIPGNITMSITDGTRTSGREPKARSTAAPIEASAPPSRRTRMKTIAVAMARSGSM